MATDKLTLKLTPGVRRQSLPEQVAVAILEALVEQRLKPGDPLPPAGELAERFGVSRPVVREALADLMGRGVVSRTLNREPTVAMPGPDQLRELFMIRINQDDMRMTAIVELRLPLEIEAARLAAQRRTPEELAAIEEAFTELAAAKHESRFLEADLRFHREVALACGNLLFTLVLDSIAGLMHDFRRKWYAERRAEGGLPALVEEHRRVLDAIRAGDADAAGEAMSEHLLTGLAKIR